MANRDHKVVHKEPSEKSGLPGLNVVMVVIAIVGAALGADQYIDNQFAELRKSISSLSTGTSEHLNALNDTLSDLSTTTNGRLKAVNNTLSDLSTTTNGRLKAVEDQLLHLPNNIRQTFDTVYVFKHTFDFPNPAFELERDEARDLICTSDKLPTTDELREEKKLYRKEVVAFDASAQFKFYTMGQEKDKAVQTIIRQEMACYNRIRRRNEIVPRERRITHAPVEIQLETQSAIYSDGTWSRPYNPSFDHDDGDSKTYTFSGLHEHGGPQVHWLTATIVDREKSDQEFCQDYEIEAATRKLDRCDLEVFIFAYLDSPPLPPPPKTKE